MWRSCKSEVHKYLTKDVNYGKVAKRLYNIFRLTGCYEEAAFLRELFDEPATLLYQVWSLIRTIDDTVQPGASIAMDNVLAQADTADPGRDPGRWKATRRPRSSATCCACATA